MVYGRTEGVYRFVHRRMAVDAVGPPEGDEREVLFLQEPHAWVALGDPQDHETVDRA